ncbi:hypothetical protein ACOCEA_03410 [Maribacter sp. CXY002]
MKTRQEKADWLKTNLTKSEKAKRMFKIKKNQEQEKSKRENKP